MAGAPCQTTIAHSLWKICYGNRRNITIPVLFVALFLISNAKAAPPPGYYLVWGDEFNSTSLDRSKWDYWLLGHRRDAVNVTNAVSVDGSNLVITTYTSNKVHYTGMIATHEKFRSRYGYWESRIRWGDTNGMWSAFWMQSPEMIARLPDPQLSGSELDIAEHRFLDKSTNNIANQIQVNIHWDGYGRGSHSSGSGNKAAGLADGFHTYGFLWTPNSYSFLVDDLKVYDGGRSPVCHSTEWMIFSSEVDDTSTLWAGHIPAEGYGSLADSTTQLMADYVRYYAPTNVLFWTGAQSDDCTNPGNWIANLTPLPGNDLTFSSLSANSKCFLRADCSINSLVFLEPPAEVSIEGTNTLTIGGGGIDMSAASRPANIGVLVSVNTPQTWEVGQKAGALKLNGGISASETLNKTGAGILILAGTNTFGASLNVETGGLVVNGLLTANPLTVRGKLAGNGVVAGPAIVDGGTVSPSDSWGTLTFTGNLTLSSNSITRIEIHKTNHSNSQIKITGPLVYNGNLAVTNTSGELAAGDVFKIFDATRFSGAFEHMTLPPLSSDLKWNTDVLTNGFLSVVAVSQK